MTRTAVQEQEQSSAQQLCKERSSVQLSRVSAKAMGKTGLAGSPPHYAHFAFAGEEGTENKYLTVEYFCVGDALPSFLPLPSLMCKCSLSLK